MLNVSLADISLADLSHEDLMLLPKEEREGVAFLLAEMERRKSRRKFHELFPDVDTEQPDGSMVYARHKYAKHLEFFEAGATYQERCFRAANRVGKTLGSAYETSAHLTGLYPDWWIGRRFRAPINCWAAGKTNETTRDLVQPALLGDIAFDGPRKVVSGIGMVPGELLGKPAWKQGVPNLVDTIKVKHVTGGWSTLGFKSYEQGRGAFEGAAKHVIWLDEECPLDIYGECLIRLMTTNGIIMLSFTPLEGMSKTVLQFAPEGERPYEPPILTQGGE